MIVLVKGTSFLSGLVTQHLPNKISRRRSDEGLDKGVDMSVVS